MKNTIRELWEMNISSVGENACVAERQAPILHTLNQLQAHAFQSMTDEEKALLERMRDLHGDLSAIEVEESFVRVFLLGARLMLEILP